MKWATLASTLLPLASASGFTKEQYASGEVMELMMMGKEACVTEDIPGGQHG